MADVYNLMFDGICITEQSSEQDRALAALLKLARSIAYRYDNYKRWSMDKEELFGELAFEAAKAIKDYYDKKPYEEFLQIAKMMLWNRMRELAKRAYGTWHKYELTAYTIPEEKEDSDVEDVTYVSFVLHEFMNDLSPIAQKIVTRVLDPDDSEMQDAILDYILRRKKLYKRGAGVSGIPKKVIISVMNIKPAEAKAAFAEIEFALHKENNMPADIIDFKNKLVTWQDVKVDGSPARYETWNKLWMIDQMRFRGLYREGMSRVEMTSMLRKHDSEHGVPTDTNLPISPLSLSQVKKVLDKKQSNGNSNHLSEAVDLDDDDEFGPVKKKEVVKQEEPVVLPKAELVVEKKEEIVENKTQENPVVVEDKAIAKDDDPFLSLIKLLRDGETLIIKKVGADEWEVSLKK